MQVGAMNHAAKTAVRDVRHEVVGLGCSAISPATQVNQPQVRIEALIPFC